ncbi:Lsr2 family DNA-binding protein [Jatrophihabitans sp. YIM 134969]
MQITIDSTEPLATVTAVVGALYGVELVVADGSGGTAAPAAPSTGRRGRGGARVSAARTTRSSGRGRRSGSRPDPKLVRQWAVEQGMTVSTRGQLPKAVLTAYADSH